MDAENGNTDGSDGERNRNFDGTNEDQPVNSFSFASLSETKTTKRRGEAILEVAEQTTAYNVQVSSNNPATIEALQPGQGDGSVIVIDQPDQVIIHENMRVKDSSKVQIGQNNVISSALTDNSQGTALIGATSATSPPQLVIRKPGTVLLYSRKDIDSCDAVQIGDNNIMGKLIPQEDKFVKTCIKLGINPKEKEDIFVRLGDEEIREQFATMMSENSVRCKLKNAGEGCILLELEVPTEEDRLQLLRMARDGTFQQVLLETFLPEFAAEGRAVNMNLAIGVRNPSQAMVEELQGATASSDHEEVAVKEIPAADNVRLLATNQDQPESTTGKHSKQCDDTGDLAEGHKNPLVEEIPDVTSSKATLKGDVTLLSQKLLSEADEEEDEITVSVEGYAEAVALGTGATAAANFPPQGLDDKYLTCDICHNIYSDPRVLPCGHTFCARCLETWRKRKSEFTCPTCRREVKLQETGVTSLPPNFDIKDLLDVRVSEANKKAYAQCQMCQSGARVEGSCRDCNFFLCKICIAIHGKTPALKDHHVIHLGSPTDYCLQHTNQPMAFYCQPCAKFVCRECTINEHKPGPNHDPQEVSKASQKFTVELEMLVRETRNTADMLEKTIGNITKELASITTNTGLQKTKIREHFAVLRAKLVKAEQEVTKKLEEMGERQKEPLLKKKEELTGILRSNTDGVQFCSDMLARGNSVEILTFGQHLKGSLDHLRAKNILYKGLKEQISFKAGTETLEPTLGSLSLYKTSYIVPELPVESLPTVIIFRPKEGQVEGTKVIVTSLWRQSVKLDATRISEGVYEVVWRPKTSGTHVVEAMVVMRKRQHHGMQHICVQQRYQPHTVDVGSNNPVLRFGQEGSQQGQFDTPIDVAVRGDRLYVADLGNKRVQVFDLSGNFYFSLSTTANFRSVAVQTDGTIVVNCDDEVMKFSPSGELIYKFPLGEYCTDPYGLAVQRDGRVVVADRVKNSIFLFESDGTLVKQVGGKGQGEGQFDDPCFVCVDEEDNIIVSDANNHRVQVFYKNLNFQQKFGQKGKQPQDMWSPRGVSADSRGNIVLANIGGKTSGVGHSHKLQVFRQDGTWVSTISSDGDKLYKPHGVAVTDDGHVFVTDTGDHCIRKYRYM